MNFHRPIGRINTVQCEIVAQNDASVSARQHVDAASDVGAMQGFGRTSLGDTDKSILMSLKQLYAAKLRPLEAKGKFHEIGGQPALSDAWFDSKPMVLLIGQYSVGKTSFIRYLLGRDAPGRTLSP